MHSPSSIFNFQFLKRNPRFQSLGRVLIVLFCFWQMFAVAVTAIPDEARDRVSTAIRPLRTFVWPYIGLTSQWQRWNLFSPEPLRDVTRYAIVAEVDDHWKQVELIAPETLSPWRRSAQLKLLRNLQEQEFTLKPLVERYIQLRCEALAFPAGTPIGMIYRTYTILPSTSPVSLEEWATWRPGLFTEIGPRMICLPS